MRVATVEEGQGAIGGGSFPSSSLSAALTSDSKLRKRKEKTKAGPKDNQEEEKVEWREERATKWRRFKEGERSEEGRAGWDGARAFELSLFVPCRATRPSNQPVRVWKGKMEDVDRREARQTAGLGPS